MTISKGDTLPDATLLQFGKDGPEPVQLGERLRGRKVVIFAVPGAFTPTCHLSHLPSFVKNRDQFDARDVDEVICIAVNDPFVMNAWDEASGAGKARITMLADPKSKFTTAIGMNFDAAALGLLARSQRYAMVVEDGKVTLLQKEDDPTVCDVSGGKALLDAM
ncbi:peroxiredoxin [Pontibaca methylaminivorans]|uniref:peroxiredoxin n=1 Tax=Pontibaca methylaminivorans TaxID=515897 RepID=UPI002FD9AABB